MNPERRLTIEFEDGDVDEYRIMKSNVEFRPRHRGPGIRPQGRSEWRRLDAEDIALHLALDTPVAQWLTVRLLKIAGPRRTPAWRHLTGR